MEKTLSLLERIVNRLPGPGKIIFGGLTSDRQALSALVACMAAILAASLQPPVMSLYIADMQEGLRNPGSGVPIETAATYLLLAVLTLVGGASGDIFGRKRFLLFGLVGVLFTNILGMFFLHSPLYGAINAMNTISMILVMPMVIAIITLVFPIEVRPFAYGTVFATQGIALVLSSSIYGIFVALNLDWVAFIPAILMGIVAIRLVRRDTTESRAPKGTSKQELILNVVWASAIFGLTYGLLAYGGGANNRNMFIIVAICVIGFVVAYRWVTKRLRKTTARLYNVKDLSIAIFAGIMLSLGQGTLFYQIGAFFQKIQSIGPVVAGLQLAPYIIAMMAATMVIVRLSMRFGARRIISGGLVLMGLGLASMFFVKADTPYWQLIVPLLVMGFGFGIASPARTVVVLTAPPPGLTGMAAGVNSAAGQSGFSLGIILSSYLLTQFADRTFIEQLRQNNAPELLIQAVNKAFEDVFARAIAGNMTRLPDELAKQITLGFGDAFATGMAWTFVITGLLLLGAAVVTFVGMNKGLKASFISQPIGSQKTEPAAEPTTQTTFSTNI